MACHKFNEFHMKITYRSRICPQPEYKFDIDKSRKRGRTRVLLHNHTIAHVEEYHDIYWFFNYLSEVWERKHKIPHRYLAKRTSQRNFVSFCEEIEDGIIDRVRQYPSPVGAHMQLYLFTHWFHFIEIGKKIRAHGHEFEDVMSACRNSRNLMKDVTDLMGELSNIHLDGMIFSKETGDNHWSTDCFHVKT